MVHNLKCVVIGDSGVGKSSLLTRFVKGEFRGTAGTRSTISAAFLERQVELGEGVSVKLEIWDTAGQERFRSLNTPMYYRGAAGAVLVYDACNAESWRNVPGWYSQLRMMGERNCTVAMCASKLDLALEGKRVVPSEEARKFVDSQRIPVFYETSAKTGENVEELFISLARAMVEAGAAEKNGPNAQGHKLKLEMPPARSSSCC